LAAANGDVGLVQYTLSHVQPINSVLDGILLLHAASFRGSDLVVKLLIEQGGCAKGVLENKDKDLRERELVQVMERKAGSTGPLDCLEKNWTEPNFGNPTPDGSKIVSGSDDWTIQVWDATTGIEIFPPLRGHDSYVRSAAFSLDGSKIISGSHDKTIRIWDASTGVGMLPPLRGHDGSVNSVVFSPDSSKIVSESHDKTIRIWDASTGVEMLPPLRGHDRSVNSVVFSPDASKIVSGSDDMTIRVWDASTGVEVLPPLRGHDLGVNSVAFSPDGSKNVCASQVCSEPAVNWPWKP